MDLKTRAEEISATLANQKQSKADRIKVLRELIDETNEELKVARAQGDLSENAEYHNARDSLTKYKQELASVSAVLKDFEKIDDTEKRYKPIGMVTVYSTVRLLRLNDNKSFIFKIYPKGIGNVWEGILDIESRLGQQLLLKQEGDTVAVQHRINGKDVKYLIQEIY